MSNSANSLRKAAILVSSLDRQSADALLDSMPEDLAHRVRQAVLNLDGIDPREQQEIISEFLGGQGSTTSPGGVELDPALARKLGSPVNTSAMSPPRESGPATPTGFLHGATSETLCKLLQREQPQTAALVVAHLPPERAADVLASFPASFQAEVLKRIADLDEASPEVLRELEQSLEHQLASEVNTSRRRAMGLAALGAILSAAPRDVRQGMLSNLSRTNAELADSIKSAGEGEFDDEQHEPRAKVSRFGFFWSRPAAQPLPPSPRPMSAEDLEDEEVYDDEAEADDTELEETAAVVETEMPVVAFDDFLRFDNRSLALVLKAADPRIAILALTGARPELVDRLLKQLPSQQAKELRKRMIPSGPLRLRDVEVAQRQLALVAGRLAAKGEIKLPQVRRFAAAA